VTNKVIVEPQGPTPSAGTLRLDARHVSKTFAGQVALHQLSLQLAAGEVHGLLGENGSGKSTFIKILSGYHRPDPGSEILVNGRELRAGSPTASAELGCRFVHQDLGLIDELSVLDNLSINVGYPTRLGTIREGPLRRRARQDLERVGLDIDPRTLVGELSPARKSGVAIARALQQETATSDAVLVLDEPTATLPAGEVEHLLSIIRRVAADGVAVLYVTHRLDEVFEVTSRVSVLRDGRLVAQRATASLNHRELVRLLVGSELEETQAKSATLAEEPGPSALTVEDFRAGTVHNVSFSVRPGEVVGVAGITGSGRETLLASLFGGQRSDSGTVKLLGKPLPSGRPDVSIAHGLAMLPNDRKRLGGILGLSARENVCLPATKSFRRGIGVSRQREHSATSYWFSRLKVRPSGAEERSLDTFSGGNQQKVLFGKWLRLGPKVLLLDEPTQGVDIGAKADIHAEILAAAAAGTAVMVASSDIEEIVALSTRVIIMRNGTIAGELDRESLSVPAVSELMLGHP
jgi:ribose transport system ATP-binding protein